MRQLRRVPSLASSLVREGYWRARARASEPVTPTWPLDASRLAEVELHWPTDYGWKPAHLWLDPLHAGLRESIRIRYEDLPQPYAGVIVFNLSVGNARHDVAIDFSDYSTIDEECVGRSRLYFKMQYLSEGYGFDHVIPGGFPSYGMRLYKYRNYLREMRRERKFSYDVFGRFSPSFGETIRASAVGLLQQQQRFHFEGGLGSVRYSSYLGDVARSKICIDLPGLGDFCFRLIDYLAVGSCVVGPRPNTVLHVPLIDQHHIVYCRQDLSDLVSLCSHYLEHDEEREQIASAAAAFFDQYLEKRQLAGYYIHSCLAHLT